MGQIERAYREAEAAGVAVWCQDEAGPYQTKPYPGASWKPEGHPRAPTARMCAHRHR